MKFRKFLFIGFLLLLLTSISIFRPGRVLAGDCGGPIPPAPGKVWAKSGPTPGQITLYWDGASHANRYALEYGTKSGSYVYGADNIGGESSRSYTVNLLTPGGKYYFRLAAARDCSSSPFSGEFSAVAMGGEVKITKTVSSARTIETKNAKQAAVSKSEKTTSAGKKETAGKQGLWAKAGPKQGEVTLYWQHADSADNYHLVYGSMPGNYQYGALNIGKVTSFTVGYLTPGKTYYFALVPLMGDRPLYTTAAVSGVAKTNAQMVVTSKEALITPDSMKKTTITESNVTLSVSPTLAPEPTLVIPSLSVAPTAVSQQYEAVSPSPVATGVSDVNPTTTQ